MRALSQIASASVVALLILLAGCTAEPAPASFDGRPATLAVASFALFVRDGEMLVVTGQHETVVRDPDATPIDNANGSGVSAVDADSLAVLRDGRLSLVHADGSATSMPCPRCLALVWTGADLAVSVISASGADHTFEIVRYSTELEETGRAVYRQLTERTDPDADRNASGVQLLAASPSTLWVAYVDRFGFARGGSRTIAAYARDGSLLRYTRVPGSIYADAVSDDGRFLAVTNGGSGGACTTAAELDVIDLTTMHSLDTSPRIPTAALLATDPDDVPELNFVSTTLVWHGGVVTAYGITSRGNAQPGEGSGCDPEARNWARHYDTSTQTFDDTEVTNAAATGVFLGPECGDTVRWDDSAEHWEISSASGQRRTLDGTYSIWYRPRPTACPEAR